MVPFVLCFGVEFLCYLGLLCVFVFLFGFGWLGGRLLWVAARSACGVFSGCRCLVVSLVFPTSVFGVVIFF